MESLQKLFSMAAGGRIALYLLINPWSTSDEISKRVIMLSKDRIRHILLEMYAKGLVERRRRTTELGRRPYEYRLIQPIRNLIRSKLRFE